MTAREFTSTWEDAYAEGYEKGKKDGFAEGFVAAQIKRTEAMDSILARYGAE